MKLYEFDVTTVSPDGGSHLDTVEGVQRYDHTSKWVQFFDKDLELVAEFRSDAVISIIRGEECDPPAPGGEKS